MTKDETIEAQDVRKCKARFAIVKDIDKMPMGVFCKNVDVF